MRVRQRWVLVTLSYVGLLYLAWVLAWVLALWLRGKGFLSTAGERVVYWTWMKVFLWVLPSLWLIRRGGRGLVEAMRGRGWAVACFWGVGAGLLIGVEAMTRKLWGGSPFSLHPNWGWWSAVLIAPVVEEITFRGAVLGGLMKRYSFGWSNTWAALLFVGAHLPGWYFMGSLSQQLSQPIGGALSIFFLGWIFGWVVHKSGAISAGIITHSLNNLFSSLSGARGICT